MLLNYSPLNILMGCLKWEVSNSLGYPVVPTVKRRIGSVAKLPKYRESRFALLYCYETVNTPCNSLYTEKTEPIF